MEKMIDIHNHLIPDFDDGPKSLDESLQMLWQAADQGITDVFATSHFNEIVPPEQEQEYFEKLAVLRDEVLAEKIPVNIYSGAELFYHATLDQMVKKHKVSTLGNWGQYVLMEFPMFQIPDGIEQVLFHLSLENYIPIVAHPERYNLVLENPERALNFIKYGGLLQINGGSVLGHFGRETRKVALNLLEKRLVHFIASDAHSPDGRTFVLEAVYDYLQDKLPESYLEELLYKNPKNIIDEVAIEKVNLPEEEEKKSFFERIRNKIMR